MGGLVVTPAGVTTDKPQAIRDIIAAQDVKALLAQSGYGP